MNRKEWRTRAADEVNWNLLDVDARFLDEVGRDQQSILDTVHTKAPGAFVPDTETVFLYKDVTSTQMGRTVFVDGGDARVLVFSTTGALSAPAIDGTWDAVMHIEVKDPEGKWHRRHCREFFLNDKNEYCVTIDRPWRNLTDLSMPFRIHQPFVVLRGDVTQVLDAQVYDASRAPIAVLPEGWAHFFDKHDFQGRTRGRPESMYRSNAFHLEAPNRAPTVALATGELVPPPWVGDEPPGQFVYCFTYVWGRRGAELVAPSGIQDPVFESSPSPESTPITAPGDGSRALDITLPEIDWQLNFNLSGTTSATHSGYRIRIYRRRVSITGSLYKQKIEYPNVFQLLAEVDGSTTTYRDNGSVIPDYHRRLPETHGYYLWRVTPYPDNEYMLDVRVRRKPPPLRNDYDAPRVDPSANEMLVLALMAKLYRKKGNFVEAENCWQKFLSALGDFRGEFANPAQIVPGIMRGGAEPVGWNITLAPYRES